MGIEIERKFLVRGDAWRQSVDRQYQCRQGYLANTGHSSVRVRVMGERAMLNIKSATLGIRRDEYEYMIPVADAEQMLASLCQGHVIEKVRYLVPLGAHTWEIDVFAGDNAGLVVAEIELSNENEPFERPDWLGEEVSLDTRYYNVCLLDHPYKDW